MQNPATHCNCHERRYHYSNRWTSRLVALFYVKKKNSTTWYNKVCDTQGLPFSVALHRIDSAAATRYSCVTRIDSGGCRGEPARRSGRPNELEACTYYLLLTGCLIRWLLFLFITNNLTAISPAFFGLIYGLHRNLSLAGMSLVICRGRSLSPKTEQNQSRH